MKKGGTDESARDRTRGVAPVGQTRRPGERPEQAKGAYDIAKKNAGDVKPIGGVGDEAYWDDVLRVFRVVKGNVGVDVTIASDLGGLKTARAIAEKVVAKLP